MKLRQLNYYVVGVIFLTNFSCKEDVCPGELPLLLAEVELPLSQLLYVEVYANVSIYNLTMTKCANSTASKSHVMVKVMHRESEMQTFELVSETLLDVPEILPDDSYSFVFTFTPNKPGRYQLNVMPDALNEVAEQDE